MPTFLSLSLLLLPAAVHAQCAVGFAGAYNTVSWNPAGVAPQPTDTSTYRIPLTTHAAMTAAFAAIAAACPEGKQVTFAPDKYKEGDYYQGAGIGSGVIAKPPQCNYDVVEDEGIISCILTVQAGTPRGTLGQPNGISMDGVGGCGNTLTAGNYGGFTCQADNTKGQAGLNLSGLFMEGEKKNSNAPDLSKTLSPDPAKTSSSLSLERDMSALKNDLDNLKHSLQS